MKPPLTSDPGDAASYAERATRHVPGLQDMHRMAGILLAEHVPENGRLLVLGAGGGLELRAFAQMHPGWHFDGVDPSAVMIAQARVTLGDEEARVVLHQGYIDDAPDGPFDGATCLLTLHFLARDARLHTLRELHRRLRPGAPLVIANHSFPLEDGAHDLWLRRNAAWLIAGGRDAAQARAGIAVMKERLPVLPPEEETLLLETAGFRDVEMFYAAFTFRGWVARA